MKTHLAITSPTGVASACGRGARMDTSASRTTCLNCQRQPEYIEAKANADAKAEAAFWAQTPGPARGQFDTENIVCRECDGDMFRPKGRSCYGHYEDYKCANCGHVTSRITETGMSF